MHLIQLKHPEYGRRVGWVREPDIVLLKKSISSTYQLFKNHINSGTMTGPDFEVLASQELIPYDLPYLTRDSWQILTPVDTPDSPLFTMLSGTGLTHKASAENRHKMHDSTKEQSLTDSMKMYLMGEKGGKYLDNKPGVQPEWFYKGNGNHLKAHGEALMVPTYADDGGEEPEIAGVYIISDTGDPWRIGFAQANEFSDHVMEKINYLYLAPSKLRTCSLGPELVLNLDPARIPGLVQVERNDSILWEKEICTGEDRMVHSISNLEYHHFKYQQHCIPGLLHIHFFGADAFSFGNNIRLQDGDIMQINFEKMGRPLKNPIRIAKKTEQLFRVHAFSF